MRAYPFAPIAAREYPTISLLNNPYIWGGVSFCVNVSEKPYPVELAKTLADHGIDWIYCPVSEEDGAQWLDALMTALPRMLYAYKTGLKQVIHCDFGNNRSRSVGSFSAHFISTENQNYPKILFPQSIGSQRRPKLVMMMRR